jgi:LacI family transcriptional regulator
VVQTGYHRQPGLAADAVVQDDAGGIGLAVGYLRSHGHHRIGYLDTTAQYRASGRALNAEQRLAGFKAAAADLGIGPECVIQPFAGDAAGTVGRFLDGGVTALVLPHIDHWPAIRAELERRGLALPGDFGLVAWGLDPKPGDGSPCPTAITWSREQMGREAVRRLLVRMRGERVEPATVLIPCRLVDRGTGGRGPAGGGEA